MRPEMRNFVHGLYDRLTGWPPYRLVRFGSFKRVTPISRGFDHGRGMFIDRYYIDQFMQRRSSDIRGYVLEIGDDVYTRLFGGESVCKCDILDVRPMPVGPPLSAISMRRTASHQISTIVRSSHRL